MSCGIVPETVRIISSVTNTKTMQVSVLSFEQCGHSEVFSIDIGNQWKFLGRKSLL